MNPLVDMEATPPENTLTIARPADPVRFFVVSEFPVPPVTVLSENFDGVAPPNLPANWSADHDDALGNTAWELGTPSNVGPVPPGIPLPSGTNCVGTNHP